MLVKWASEHYGHTFGDIIFDMHIRDIIGLGISLRPSALFNFISWHRQDNATSPESVVTHDHICVSSKQELRHAYGKILSVIVKNFSLALDIY